MHNNRRRQVKLKEVCERITVGFVGAMAKEYVETGVPLLRSLNIRPFKLDLNDLKFVSEDFHQNIRKSALKEDDVVIVRTGAPGTSCVIPAGFEHLNCSDLVIVTPDKDKLNPHYLSFYFNTLASHYVSSQLVGAIQQHFNVGSAKEMVISLPCIEEQNEIVEFVNSINSKISLNNRINAELEALAKTIYDYWFVQFDFPISAAQAAEMGKPELEGKPYKSSGGEMVWNEELKREVPKGWEVKTVKNFAKIIMGQSPKGESYNNKGIGTPLLNGPADYENDSLRARTYTTAPTRVCEKDDLVFCIRATIGKLTIAEQSFCLGRGVAAVRPNSEKYLEYVFYKLNYEIERFKIHASGSIIKGITKDDLTDAQIALAPEKMIEGFHDCIKPIFDKVRINKKQNQELASLRDWLLPMLMNGQVTFAEASVTEGEEIGQEGEVGAAAEGRELYS